MSKSLVIVESPAKCRTLSKFLGENFDVVASMGHLIDLPSSNMGVDIEDNFKPNYVVISKRKKILKELKDKAQDKSIIYLATDPDREGEAISWHLGRELCNEHSKGLRVEFHEITRSAIDAAFKNPRELDMNKVNAQQSRRILDRIVGYNLSPLLWKKVGKGLSAGRVQSVALRLIVDREHKIKGFVPEEYWEIEAQLQKIDDKSPAFSAKLNQIKGKKPQIKDQKQAQDLVELLRPREYILIDVKQQQKVRKPPAAYTTSKMQQDAFNRLRFPANKTMRVAQQLYEGLELGSEGSLGLITYMRTDSTTISNEAQAEAREYIKKEFGPKYIPKHPHKAKQKARAQQAHEAIRPTSVNRQPKEIRKYLSTDQYRLYELIWVRFLQSQMSSAVFNATTADISARLQADPSDDYIFRATGSQLIFDGFLKVRQDEGDEKDENAGHLPRMAKDEGLKLIDLIPSQHFTKPPARFSDASLVKELEEKDIGRPSTYAPIISTIVDRHYVERKSGYFYPTDLGMVVTELLVKHFPQVLSVSFTAEMEDELDKVEEGTMDWVQVLKDFYGPFNKSLSQAQVKMKDMKKEHIRTEYKCELCGKVMLFRWSKRGTFLGCSGFPKCKSTKPATKAEDGSIQVTEVETIDEACQKCGKPMIVKYSRRGKFLSCSDYPRCKNAKPFPTGVKCPQPGCDGELLNRYSRRGPFYGCSRYPDCKYTARNLPEKTN